MRSSKPLHMVKAAPAFSVLFFFLCWFCWAVSNSYFSMANEEPTGLPTASSGAADASAVSGLPPAALEGLLHTIRQVVREELAANRTTGDSNTPASATSSNPPPCLGELGN